MDVTVLQLVLEALWVLTPTASMSPEVTAVGRVSEQDVPIEPLQIVRICTTTRAPFVTVSVSPVPPQGEVNPLLFPSVSVKVACQ